VERDVKVGATGKTRPHRRRMSWIPLAVLVAVFLVFAFYWPYYSKAAYRDVKTGRELYVTTIYLIPIKKEVIETPSAEIYIKYVSENGQWPIPDWRYEHDRSMSLLDKTLGDSFAAEAFMWLDDTLRLHERKDEDSGLKTELMDAAGWKAFFATLSSIFTRPEKPNYRDISRSYVNQFRALAVSKPLPLHESDLPDIEKISHETEIEALRETERKADEASKEWKG
jgi:hypothetical protein